MNARFFRAFLPLACLLASAGTSAQPAAPQPKGPVVSLPLSNRMVRTCPNPNPGYIFLQQDGGYEETSQGWFYQAQVHQGSGWAQAYCYYGLDEAAPSNRPVYTVHYQMTGYNTNQCTVSGKTVTCSRPLVLEPKK